MYIYIYIYNTYINQNLVTHGEGEKYVSISKL